MKGFNCVQMGGFLTRDPELRYAQNGTPVCTFGLAVNGIDLEEKNPTVVYIDVVSWHKQAEACAKHLIKGRLVLVEGRLAMRRWADRFQVEKVHYEIMARAVHFVQPQVNVEVAMD